MVKYTQEIIKCRSCWKQNNFDVEVVEKDGIQYYLTRCPKCKSYDEIKKLTPDSGKRKASPKKD